MANFWHHIPPRCTAPICNIWRSAQLLFGAALKSFFWRLIPILMLLTFAAMRTFAATSDAATTTDMKPCRDQISAGFSYYIGSVVQSQLLSLYQNNLEFQDALQTTPQLLTDGNVGSKTEYWLAYFCNDFSLAPTKGSPIQTAEAFAESLQINLSRASQLNTLFPKWRNKIEPSKLLHLSATEVAQLLYPNVSSSSDTTTNEIGLNTPFTESPYYQLTESDFKAVADFNENLEAIDALKTQQFEQRSQLYNALDSFFTKLPVNKEKLPNINTLIQQHTLPTDHPSSSETQSTTTTTAVDTTEESDRGAEHTDKDTAADTAQTPNTVETNTKSTIQSTLPLIVWQVNIQALDKALQKIKMPQLSKDLIKKLKPLQDEVFFSTELLAMAMKLQGIELSVSNLKNVLRLAKKQGALPKPKEAPVNWQPKPGCGCEDSHASIFSNGVFYGFYPYWARGNEQELDFSQLDRIGYVAAVIQPSRKGSQLVLPPNWQPERQYSQFIQLAERYRSNVDLVVTLHKPTKQRLNQLLTPELIEQLVSSVTQPLDDYFINKIKPLISFGFSPIPTLGDGITLDIDLSKLDSRVSQQQFIDFVRALKLALLKHERGFRFASTSEPTAKPSDKYFLNIVVPITSVIDDQPRGFYQLDTLAKLAKYSNLMIMRPSNPSGEDQTSELEQIRSLHHWLSNQSDQLKAKHLFKKMLPMVVTADNRTSEEGLKEMLQLSSWAFTGGAYWPIPLTSLSQTLVNETFFPSSYEIVWFENLKSHVNDVLNLVCPNRWLLRLILFITFTLIVSVLLVSVWNYPLRSHLCKLPFVAVCTAALIGLLLVFIADPYFKDYQGPILLVFMAIIGWILLAVRVARKEGDKP